MSLRFGQNYIRFVRSNLRFLAFGFSLAFISSVGQTFFISIFGGEIRGEFSLSHGEFGEIYSTATLISGLLLIWAGKQIDNVNLKLYAMVLMAGVVTAATLMWGVQSVLMVGLAIFLLRFFCQGLLSHASTTTMARYIEANNRGKAVSIAAMGFPTGEAVFPILGVLAIGWFGWRESWGIVAILVAVICPVLLLWLLRGHGERHATLIAKTSGADSDDPDGERQWSRMEVLKDIRFYMMMPAIMSPAFVSTGIHFHQIHLVDTKGWNLEIWASSFAMYAVFQVTFSLISGILADRFGPRRLAPLYLVPFILGLLGLSFIDNISGAFVFMGLCGISGGFAGTIIGTLWPDMYGVRHLGAIRAMVSAWLVIASSASPAVMGWFIDAGASVDTIALVSAIYTAFAIILLWRGVSR